MIALGQAIASFLSLFASFSTQPDLSIEAAVWWATDPDVQVWDDLAFCESTGDWQIDSGNGFFGGIQFWPSSWRAVGGTGLPHEWSREEQIYRGSLLRELQSETAWPGCHAAGYLPHGGH